MGFNSAFEGLREINAITNLSLMDYGVTMMSFRILAITS